MFLFRQPRDPIGHPQVVSRTDVRPRQHAMRMVPKDDGATALRDRCIAEYEARLRNSQAQAPVAPDAGYDDPDLVTPMGAGLLRGAGHGYLLHPDRVSRPSRLAADTMDCPWDHQQQRAHKLTHSQPQMTSATRYGVHNWVVEPLGAGIAQQLAAQLIPQGSMEMPDSPSMEEDTDE